MFIRRLFASFLLGSAVAGSLVSAGFAAGPRWVAGKSYFDPSVLGQPLVWKNGVVNYYTDLGDLSPSVTQAEANAMVAAAASLWSSTPTAALQIHAAGSLAEDVNGSNFLNGPTGLTMPADVESSAIGTPLGIIYDANGAVIDALEGVGASDPDSCISSGVITLVDNFSTRATIDHALMIVNGRCASDAAHVALLQYELLRGFGRILGLDWSQANDQMFPTTITPEGLQGWPLMHPVEKLCNSNGNPCMTGTISPRTDDIAELNRLYPVTPENSALFAGKIVTAAATISIQGAISFRTGQAMQGVNVVARPLLAGSDTPDMRYPASAVSGSFFTGNAGNSITGVLDSRGLPLSRFGTDVATFEGWYDLSGIPLPPGRTSADYQLTFEPVNPLYTGDESVGPYAAGQVAPSGTMPTVILRGLAAGSTTVQNETIADSAGDPNSGGDGVEAAPVAVPVTGEWLARLSGYGHSSWLGWRIRGGRQITVEAQPVDEAGLETESKARLLIGVWNGDDPLGIAREVDTPQPFNGVRAGLTTLSFESGNDGDIRFELADQRGDGRPDYLYRGRMLYADRITPTRLGTSGGPIVIDGIGFRPGNVVSVGGQPAAITSINSMEITAIAPPSAGGATGNVDVTVTDTDTLGWTTIEGASASGFSYDAQASDGIAILTAPGNAVSIGVPLPFAVRTLAADGETPAGGISVTFTVTQGMALLGCGQNTCSALSSGDGLATMAVTATTAGLASVRASLSNGRSVATQFTGATPPSIAAVSATLHVAAGAVFNWTPEAITLSNGFPFPGRIVEWSASAGAALSTASTTSDTNGLARTEVTAGPLAIAAQAQVTACLAGGLPERCTAFMIAGEDGGSAELTAVSGTGQILGMNDAVQPAILRVSDEAGDPLAGGTVTFYESLRQWTPPCPEQGSCASGPVLATAVVEAISDASGLLSLTPLTDGGVPTRLEVLAVTGDATLAMSIERHP